MFFFLADPIPAIELQLKISGPSEVRYNEPAQFRCSANRDDIEWTMALDQQKMKMGFGSGEFLLKAGQLQRGINQFVLECSGLDDNNDKVTISHYVTVLCKLINTFFLISTFFYIWCAAWYFSCDLRFCNKKS